MGNGSTELIFILDRSGSMAGMEGDTIGGFNSMLRKQRGEPGECRITTVLFDGQYEVLHDRIDVRAVRPLTKEDYYVRGNTALLDAVGKTIGKMVGVQRNTSGTYRADKVVFVITTDGMENASREFGYGDVKALVERQRRDYGWEFIFLGANIDAVEVAGRVGVAPNRAQRYNNDKDGIALNYGAISDALSSYRAAPMGARIGDGWSSMIKKDYERRGGGKA